MGCYKAPKCVVRKTTTFLSVQIDFLFFKHETLNAITQQKNSQRCGIHARKQARSPRHSCRSAKRYNLQGISRRTPVYPEVKMRNGTSSPPMKCGCLPALQERHAWLCHAWRPFNAGKYPHFIGGLDVPFLILTSG